jgi:predicted dehydrogenase
MQSTGAAMAAAVLTGRGAFAADSSETLKVGLIGCGGRGTGAAGNALRADPNTKLVAIGDAFRDMADSSLKTMQGWDIADRVTVDEGHIFSDFDNYKGVIDACDVVVLAAPPAFRPEHLAYAVEKGVHVFCEKPVAVDPAGVRSILDTCRKAKEKRINIVSGLCYRYQFAKQETIQRLRDGAIGEFTAMETVYNTGALWHKGNNPDWSEMEYQIRNWIYFCWLSGDHNNEQHIHSLDKIAWAMGDEYPVKCVSSGGRVQRTDPKFGNVYDHFNTTYEYKSGLKCFSSCRQWDNAATAVYDNIYGTQGTAYIQEHKIDGKDGKWRYKGEGPDDMYQNEHNALFKSIRAGEVIVDEYMAHSTLMAIMARMSAYTGKEITWKAALESELNLLPETLAWGPAPNHPIAVPGVDA